MRLDQGTVPVKQTVNFCGAVRWGSDNVGPPLEVKRVRSRSGCRIFTGRRVSNQRRGPGRQRILLLGRS